MKIFNIYLKILTLVSLFRRALGILQNDFDHLVENQDLLSSKEKWEAILSLIPLPEDILSLLYTYYSVFL